MNTSMTINATAMWLLALYQVVAEEQGVDITQLQGTTQNDIVKEYLSRGTHVFPPVPSLRLTTDMICYTVNHIPKWNPINICSYHLQEAGATPVQEIAYAMSTAIAVLDAVFASGQIPEDRRGDVVARISFFVNAGVRFIEEMCKMRAFGRIWDQVTRERYGIENPKQRRFRYGVQVNSLGLTEAQPENNVQRIVLEMLAVTLSKDARARAVQLPAWNEALGLPRPWDQQWSLRIQQVLAHESDLLEYADIFDGSHVIEAKVASLVEESLAEIDRIEEMGGAMAAVESGYLKSQLVSSHAERRGPYRVRSGKDRRRQHLQHDRAQSAHRRPRHGDPDGRPGRRGPRHRVVAAVAGHALPAAVQPPAPVQGAGAAEGGREGHGQPHGGHPGVRPRRCHDRRVGRGPAGGVRRVPGAHGRLVGAGRGARRGGLGDGRRTAQGGRDGARHGRRQAALPGRQAGPRRALQRRRADRRTRA